MVWFLASAERLHGRLELLGVDRAGAIRVEEVEGLADLLDLLLGEAGALVGLRGTLGHGCLCLRETSLARGAAWGFRGVCWASVGVWRALAGFPGPSRG